jgi:hypothetical protein
MEIRAVGDGFARAMGPTATAPTVSPPVLLYGDGESSRSSR